MDAFNNRLYNEFTEKLSALSLASRSHETIPKLTLPESTANSSLSAVSTESDDDVILIEREIPVIDLCTPQVAPQSSRVLKVCNGQTNATPKSTNNSLVAKGSLDVPNRATQLMCHVCLRSWFGRAPHATECGHVFCGECIKGSMIRSALCPKCKKYVIKRNVFPLHL